MTSYKTIAGGRVRFAEFLGTDPLNTNSNDSIPGLALGAFSRARLARTTPYLFSGAELLPSENH